MTLDSDIPAALEPLPKSAQRIVTRGLNTSEQLQKLDELRTWFPETEEGDRASGEVVRLIDEVHGAKYEDVPKVMVRIKDIYAAWKITLKI